MGTENEKCVIVMDGSLPLGLIANTAAILGITIGRARPEVVGADVMDRDGGTHLGIITFPVPVLRGTPEVIKQIRGRLQEAAFQDVTAVDFTDLAQGCRTYGEFIEKMGQASGDSLRYLGVAVCGGKKKVNALTGSLPLLR